MTKCPTCNYNVSEDGEFPMLWNGIKTLVCASCGSRVTEHGKLVPNNANLVKPKKQPKTFDLNNIGAWAPSLLNSDMFVEQF